MAENGAIVENHGVSASTRRKATGDRMIGPSQSSSRSSWFAGGFSLWMRRGSATQSSFESAVKARLMA